MTRAWCKTGQAVVELEPSGLGQSCGSGRVAQRRLNDSAPCKARQALEAPHVLVERPADIRMRFERPNLRGAPGEQSGQAADVRTRVDGEVVGSRQAVKH